MIVSNLYTSITKSKFYEVANIVTNFFNQQMSVKYDFRNGLDNKRYKLFKSNYNELNDSFLVLLLHALLIDIVQIFANTFHLSSKYSHKKRSLFHEVFLTRLTCQNHLVEFYLAMTNMALEIFQKITCTLGVMYNVNVRYIESLMHMVVSLAVYKSFFD